jgi:hypothetical protein
LVCACGSFRVVTKQSVLCSKCDSLDVKDKSDTLNKLKNELSLLRTSFSNAVNETNYNQSFGSAMFDRERAAHVILSSPTYRRHAIEEWIAFTWLLHNLKFMKKATATCSNYTELVDLSRKITKLYNRLCSVESDKAVIICINGKETFEWTEKEPLRFITDDMLAKSDTETNFVEDNKIHELHTDIVWLEGGLMASIYPWLLSEEFAQLLKQSYHTRLFPYLDKSNVNAFIQISNELYTIGESLNAKRNADSRSRCFLSANDKDNFATLKNMLFNEISKEHFDWYMANVIATNTDSFNLGSTIIVKDQEKDVFWVPLYTLQMLAIANLKQLKSPQIGHAKNNKGHTVEEYFFSTFDGYEVNLKNPVSQEELIRVKHPDDPNKEIADLMGFNDKFLLVMECKFWNSPILSKLEDELKKFKANVEYIQMNVTKIGFPASLKVIPIFYTPYAPYPEWKGITLLHSISAVQNKLYDLFAERKFKLLTETEGLEPLFKSCNAESFPFPLDVAEISTLVQSNTFRIQDGVICDYDDNEATVVVENPYSFDGNMVYFEITKQTLEELKQKNIQQGDLIRMIIVNMSHHWCIVQLARFQLLAKKTMWQHNIANFKEYHKIIKLFSVLTKSSVTTPQDSS